MTKFFNKRKEYKSLLKQHKGTPLESVYDQYQLAVKIMINSLYGASGNAFFRYYDVRIASSVTLSGQLLIKYVIEYTNEKLNNYFDTYDYDYIVASDTDSIMFSLSKYDFKSVQPSSKLKELIEFSESTLAVWISEAVDKFNKTTNTYQPVLGFEREPVALRGLFLAKKRYILRYIENGGVYDDSGKLKIKGVDAVRSSTPSFYRNRLKEFYKLLLKESLTQKSVLEYIKETRELNYNQPLEKICFPRTANNIKKYTGMDGLPTKGCPVHVRAAINYNNLIKSNNLLSEYELINEGEKIKFCYVKNNPYGFPVFAYSSRIPIEAFNLSEYIDYDKMLETAFMSPVNALCKEVNIDPSGQLTLF